MKNIFRVSLLVLVVSLVACSRDNDDDTNTGASGQPSLQTYLNGTFVVDQVSYDGEIDFIVSTIPVSGVDPDATGMYVFNSSAGTVTYAASGTLNFTPPFGQTPIDIPIAVGSTNAAFSLVTETTFTIEDETWGLMTYTVNDRSSNSLTATTTLSSDTAGFSMDMRIDFTK